MSERAAYSRVYWSIVDDPKFETVYDNDNHLASWLRLLLIADQSHPSSAYLPANVRKASVVILADVGLIDLLPRNRFRVHGLDAERERRRIAATSRPPTVTTRVPDGDRTVTERGPLVPGTTGLRRDEDKTRRDEEDARDCLDTYHELTGWRPWGVFSGDKLRGAIVDYTDAKVDAALRAEHHASADRKTLLDRTLARLARDAERARHEAKSKPRPVKPKVDNDELQRVRRELSVLPSQEAS